MKVSVIIPCFNVEKYIEKCVNSVLNQYYQDIEIICVNDGSTDRTLEILTGLKQETNKINVISIAANAGAPHARNMGLQIAKGEYIQFLDADDVLQPVKIDQQVQLILNQRKRPHLLIADYYKYKADNKTEHISAIKDPWEGLFKSYLGITSANLWRKNAVKDIGGWNEKLESSQEYDLMFRIMKNGGKVIYDDNPKTYIKNRKTSISNTNLDKNWTQYIILRREIYQHLSQTGKLNRNLKEIALQEMFNAIRMLYKYDKMQAISLYDKLLRGEKFSPKAIGATTKQYLYLYSILGFPKADKVIRYFK
ncbi:MAG: glycosyl transferase family 2 [Flavobacteriales bacterium]|nr:MAG: glycosyl transferase family 2 [Flavobacteriales bacterium]